MLRWQGGYAPLNSTLGIVMFMILGAAVFMILIGSAAVGILMLLLTAGLIASRTWRRTGVIALSAGLGGAGLAALALVGLNWLTENSSIPLNTWLVVLAAGFGWAALLSLVVFILVTWLRQPARWVERKRNANT
jgi:hypothetical protein